MWCYTNQLSGTEADLKGMSPVCVGRARVPLMNCFRIPRSVKSLELFLNTGRDVGSCADDIPLAEYACSAGF